MSKPATARPTGGKMPADIAKKIRAIGAVIDPPATAAVYAPLHAKEPYAGVKVTRDVKYGPDPRHILDIFEPAQAGGPRPVFIYIHGGGYTSGHKRDGDNFFFDNIMLWAARNGMIGVNATYRLAPAHAWPAGPEDVAAVVRGVRAHVAKHHGGDASRIFLAGHSAGGTHVASYAAMPQFHGPDGHGLRGLILISGNFDLSAVTDPDERTRGYFGDDVSKYAERSPFQGLLSTQIPLFVAYGELEPPHLLTQSEQLVAALKSANRPAHVIQLPDHGHISITYSINTDDTELSDAMLAFIDNNR
jgi:acetyl esterase/lipase